MHVLLLPLNGLLGSFDISSWTEGMNPNGRGMLLMMVIGAIVLIALFVVLLIDRLHQRNAETAIKRDMIERGLSVEEMERVLATKAKNLK
jgi:uncharacterized membrane protein